MRVSARVEGTIALVFAVALVAAAAALGGPASREPDLRASTNVGERRGARALFLLLEDLGLGPERLLAPPSADMRKDRTIVVLAPSRTITTEEAQALLDWTAAGGRLVIVDAPSSPPGLVVDCSPLFGPAGLVTSAVEDGYAIPEVEDPEWAEGVDRLDAPFRIAFGPADDEEWDERASDFVPAVTSERGDLAVRVPFGSGEIVCLADARLLDNEFLRKADNAVLAVNLLAGDGTRRIAFDEFHHGYGEGAVEGASARLLAMLWTTWPGRALLCLLAAGIVFAAGQAVRLGAPDEDPAPRRRSPVEHADALGRLLVGARGAATALEVLLAGVRRTAGPRVGIPARLPPAEFRDRLGRSTARGAEELAAALADAEAAAVRPRLKDVEFADVAARVAAARRRLLDG